MYDHSKYFHPENEIDINNDYEFNILEKHKDPMTRQLTEAIRIKEPFDKNNYYNSKGQKITVNLINRKEEHFKARKRYRNIDLT